MGTNKVVILTTILLSFLSLYIVISYRKTQTLNTQAAGSDIYVAPSGSDNNNGSQSNPFASIQKAADMANPGTTIHVLPGTYTGEVITNQSGTSTEPITFISDTKWGAKITGTSNGSTKGYLFRENGDYVHIIDFDISGTGITDAVDVFGSHNLIQGNHIHDLTNINCSGSPGGSGLGDDAGSNNTYDSNIVNNIGDYPTKCDYVHGIYVDDDGDIVSNNITYHNVGNGLYTNHGTGSVVFTNNLSFANKEYGVGINGSGNGNIVQNNILMNNGIAGIKTWSGVSGTSILHNIVFNNPTNFIFDGAATDQGTITGNPKLVNYQEDGSGDYHLQSGSPAINAGVTTNAPTTDFDGNLRTQGNDIGPYAFITTNTSPTPTIPQVTITPSITSGDTTLSLTLCPHGLGNCGDNVKSGLGGNTNPKHQQKNVTVTLINASNIPVATIKDVVTYNQTDQNFQGTLSSNTISTGQYLLSLKLDGYLSKQVQGIVTINSGQLHVVPVLSLTSGDVNNDNQLDILDYNLIISCFGSKAITDSCTTPPTTTTSGSDINDDGSIDGSDYNLFLRELSVQKGS